MNAMRSQVRKQSALKTLILCVLLMLATIHCVQSIFLVNVSLFDLEAYANGHVKMPFQGRIGMMPIVRWAHDSHAMQRVATFLGNQIHGKMAPPEVYTPEKIACFFVGLVLTLVAVAFAIRMGRRHVPEAWWLPPSLVIYMLYVTYAARCDAQIWYPYDLPHFALFGMAAVCILRGSYVAAFGLFLVDLPIRETCIYLVPLLLAMGYVRKQMRVVPFAAMMLLLWIPLHVAIAHRFAGNPSDTRIHWEIWAHTLRNPYRWPQVTSAFGFLVVPFCFGFKYLTREERFFVYSALPGIAMTTVYGIWYETRIWDEWLLPAALLMSLQATRAIAGRYREASFMDDEELTVRDIAA